MANIKKKRTVKKTASTFTPTKEQYIFWYRLMLRVRRFEERALMAYGQQKIRGFCHVYIGQEAVVAGLESAITKEDAVITAYRQHGISIGRGIPMKEAMAELYGRSTGVVNGKGGSMHFFSREHRFFGGNGIVGAQIPIGAGIAFAEKYNGTKNVSVTMFGDGAARQGALYETFNMAMNWKLPVLFILENNGYAMGTSVARTSNITEMFKIGHAFDIPSEPVDGMDPVAVHEAVTKAVEHIRAGKGPYFLEIRTYRYKGHSVSDPAKYRTKEEVASYKERDPVKLLELKLLKDKLLSAEELKDIKVAVKAEVEEAVKFADASPLPDASELYTDNYVEDDYPYIRD